MRKLQLLYLEDYSKWLVGFQFLISWLNMTGPHCPSGATCWVCLIMCFKELRVLYTNMKKVDSKLISVPFSGQS